MDTQWRHKSKKSEKLGRCGRQNTLWPYLKIWDWDLSFGRAVNAISFLGVRSLCIWLRRYLMFHNKKLLKFMHESKSSKSDKSNNLSTIVRELLLPQFLPTAAV